MASDARLFSLTDMAVDRPLILFFTLAYAISWLGFLPMILRHWPIQFIIVASCGPSVSALITHRLATGGYRAFRVYSTVPRTLFSTVAGVVLVVLAYVVLPGVISADPRKLHWSILTSVTVYNYSTLLGGPLGEEPGWRGYALPRLEANLGPVRGALLLGLLWAGWHLPLFFIPGWSSSPPLDLRSHRDRAVRHHDLRRQPGSIQYRHRDRDARGVQHRLKILEWAVYRHAATRAHSL